MFSLLHFSWTPQFPSTLSYCFLTYVSQFPFVSRSDYSEHLVYIFLKLVLDTLELILLDLPLVLFQVPLNAGLRLGDLLVPRGC